jgi:hypothetical protein
MKKLILLLVLFAAVQQIMAQEEGEDKLRNVRVGLKIHPSMTWLAPQVDNKIIKADGPRIRFGYGLMFDIRLNKILNIGTGLEINYAGGRVDFSTTPDTNFYYTFKPNGAQTESKYYISNRVYNMTYVELPITLKMKTPEIGSLTYFGVFGTNVGYRVNARAFDEGKYSSNGAFISYEHENVDVKAQTSAMRLSLNVGAGAEYNLIGSTSLVMGVNFHKGYTNTLKKKQSQIKSELRSSTELNAFNNLVTLTVGVLF